MYNRTIVTFFLLSLATSLGAVQAFQQSLLPATTWTSTRTTRLAAGIRVQNLQPATTTTATTSAVEKLLDVSTSTTNAPTHSMQESVPTTMLDAMKVFFLAEYNGPRLIVAILAGLTIHRGQLLTIHPLSMVDGLVAAGAVVFWWFQEHFLHKHLLHSPFEWYGKTVHQGHHDQPYFHVSIDPANLMVAWLGVAYVGLRFLLPLPLALDATLGYAMAGLWYEFLHFIVHTKVRFRKKSYLQNMKTHHIRHHRVDSNYWLGFSLPAVDTLFGTNPSLSAVKQQTKNVELQ